MAWWQRRQERIASVFEQSQLVYTGVRRTPVCAVVRSFSIAGVQIPIMAELFATVDDAYLILGLVNEDSSIAIRRTDDLVPRHTRLDACAHDWRRCRSLAQIDLKAMAIQVIDAQAHQLARAIELNLQKLNWDECPPHLVCSGHRLATLPAND